MSRQTSEKQTHASAQTQPKQPNKQVVESAGGRSLPQ